MDSTRSGILYLSETYSKIFKEGEKTKEIITASKVSGDEQGITFNSAKDADFDFYKNSVELDNELISPIGDMAFSFYHYRLLGTFYKNDNHLINSIEVKRKTNSSPTFEGVIYIIDNDWSFYGLDLKVNRLQNSMNALNEFRIKQNFNHDPNSNTWVKSDQVIEVDAGIFGFSFFARFSAVYTHYNLSPSFNDESFGKMIYLIADGAHKKDSLFLNNRPIPLTEKERINYVKKDSIVKAHKTPSYLDSLDRESNRFKWKDFLGKEIQNSAYASSYGYSFPLTEFHFNAVQGYHATFKLFYNRDWKEEKKSIKINLNHVYGFSDQKVYPSFEMNYLMNKMYYSRLRFRAGKKLVQFDREQPLNLIVNDIYSTVLKENYSKWYENNEVQVRFSRFVKSEFFIGVSAEYSLRNPRSNTTNYSWANKEKNYEPNIPPNTHYSFEGHEIKKYRLFCVIFPKINIINIPRSDFIPKKTIIP